MTSVNIPKRERNFSFRYAKDIIGIIIIMDSWAYVSKTRKWVV